MNYCDECQDRDLDCENCEGGWADTGDWCEPEDSALESSLFGGDC